MFVSSLLTSILWYLFWVVMEPVREDISMLVNWLVSYLVRTCSYKTSYIPGALLMWMVGYCHLVFLHPFTQSCSRLG